MTAIKEEYRLAWYLLDKLARKNEELKGNETETSDSSFPWHIGLHWAFMSKTQRKVTLPDITKTERKLLECMLMKDGCVTYSAACFHHINAMVDRTSMKLLMSTDSVYYMGKLKPYKKKQAAMKSYANAVTKLIYDDYLKTAEKISIKSLLLEYYNGKITLEQMIQTYRDDMFPTFKHHLPSKSDTAQYYFPMKKNAELLLDEKRKPVFNPNDHMLKMIESECEFIAKTGFFKQHAAHIKNLDNPTRIKDKVDYYDTDDGTAFEVIDETIETDVEEQ